ncbi:Nif3-like dinuclear metal center hexameric protein [Caldalkalibacillus salinus]|uniref:Nif3-like dinuclear metal center hexameric protein n=1 Tax=Caldalkalibacillus salinus TaxID=2803787 RepID=UPI001925022E|nr:Nif3-like dinuclear metal center hexameric protein [Caldalkalibacillus salinus]
MVHAQTIIQWFEQFCPKHLAEDWDNVGLQVGSLQKKVSKVLVTLDVTREVAEEAIDEGAELIIAHHPIIFRPLKHLRTDDEAGQILKKLIQHDITVYIAHTNLDITAGGVNDWLAESLALEETEVLSPTYHEQLKKLVVFVPVDHEQAVRQALGDAGAGHIGEYSHCSFRAEGTGAFLPLEGANPFIGEQGKVEEVHEVKVETIIPASLQSKVVRAMLKAHPYEEAAYDIYPLDLKGETYGLGRVGQLTEEMTLEAFSHYVKDRLDVPQARIIGDKARMVKKIAILGGSGSKFIKKAAFKGADVFVTGDVDFHSAHDALMNNVAVVDPGHHIEKVMKQGVQNVLEQAAQQHKAELTVLRSQVNTEPFQFI